MYNRGTSREALLSWIGVENFFSIYSPLFTYFIYSLLHRAVLIYLTASLNDNSVQSQRNKFKFTTANPGNVFTFRQPGHIAPLLPSWVLHKAGKYRCNILRVWEWMLRYSRGFIGITKRTYFQYACQPCTNRGAEIGNVCIIVK